jgi:hypothetical protein
LTGELRFGSGREGRRFFVADMHPFYLAAAAEGIRHRVEAITDDAVDLPDAGKGQAVYKVIGHSAGHDLSPFQ